MTKLKGADLDRAVAHAMGLVNVRNCEKWGTEMTKEDIIGMAREAGMPPVEIISDKPVLYPVPDAIERFAALVAAAEREKVARWQIGSGYSTGHGETIEDLLVELEWQIRESEREACLDWCAAYAADDGTAQKIAAAIRARGQA